MKPSRLTRAVPLAALAAAALLGAPPAGAQTPGAPGVGDPYFPLAGNGGYQVDHYDLKLGFKPRRDQIRARATISATATQALSAFNLDLHGLRVSSVSVDGAPARFRRRGGELTVTPATVIGPGVAFSAVVAYAGRPKPVQGKVGFPTGWLRTSDGALVASEPTGAPSWFPCNDHPTDKATYTFTVTVPRGLKAIANGSLESVRRHAASTTFVWREFEPMATYLATVASGRFRVRRSSAAGIPSWVAIEPGSTAARSRQAVGHLPSMIRWLSAYIGPYPFSSTGTSVDSEAPGYILETQTRPVFGEAAKGIVVLHEQAHQWFGDAVSVQRWSDIWLNEGFATWSEWLWRSRGRDADLKRIFGDVYGTPGRAGYLWKVPPGAPGASKLFSYAVYYRGALTLEALRQTLGDPVFYSLLRDWVSAHLYGNASTQQFIALAEAESGRDLSHFFEVWLFQRGKPRNWQ